MKPAKYASLSARKTAAPAVMPIFADIFADIGSRESGVGSGNSPLPKSAFTLLEVLVVIVIIGILSALAYSSLAEIIFTSRAKETAQTMRTFAERALAEGKRQNKVVELELSGSSIQYTIIEDDGTSGTPVITALGNNFSSSSSGNLTCGGVSNIAPFSNNNKIKVKSKLVTGLSSLEQDNGYFAVCDAKDYCGAAIKAVSKNSFTACIRRGKSTNWEAL